MSETDLAQLKQKWLVRSPSDLKARRAEISAVEFLIQDFFPSRSLGIVVGDSGLGKSPLLYQMALCVASGVPFLGHALRQGRVLYMDFENSVVESCDIISRLATFLRADNYEDNLLVWNLGDCAPNWGQCGYTALDCIIEAKPALVIIDSLASYDPEVEEKNREAGKAYKQFRTVMSKTGAAIIVIHHRKKPTGDGFEGLDQGNGLRWFLAARGASSLINGSDVRLGIDEPSRSTLRVKKLAGNKKGDGEGGPIPVDIESAPQDRDAVLVIRGYRRVHGEIPLNYLARVMDQETGEALGYRRLAGLDLLFNEHQEECFRNLGDTFTFKEAKQAYGKRDQATTDLLKKCMGLGILRKAAKGIYEKVTRAE